MNLIGELQKAIAAAADVAPESVHLEHPQELEHGDYATNVAMALAKERGKNPKELAEEIAQNISLPFIEKVEVAGPGFINIHLARPFFTQTLQAMTSLGKLWGGNESNNGKTIIIEYVNANAFKQLHIGHLLGAIIGESIARLLEFSAADVKRESYGGDVGPHAAKAIYGLQKLQKDFTPEVIGEAYAFGAKAYEEDEAAKAEIDALNKAIYAGEDKDLMDLHQKGKEASIEGIKDILSILNINLDRFIFESESAPEGLKLVEEGLKNGVFTESEGAVVYEGEKKGLHTRVFKTKQGTPTYEAKEIGLEPVKDKWVAHDQSIILTGKEQKDYFKVVKAALEEINPEQGEKITHICNGLLKLTTGKMSSRTGDVVTAMSLIEEVLKKAAEQNANEDTALKVAIGAIKYQILKQQRENDIIYDVEKSLSLEGDSGPYLQYALVRAKKILRDAKEGEDQSIPEEPYHLEKMLYRFPEVVARAQELYEPHHITQYLTELAALFNSFYAHEKIIGGAHENYKLLLTMAFVQTMENGLWILNIEAPEEM
ncbi:MAG: arginine--tRNA ligase [Patescibacteria group bacterium UBA2103]